MEENPGHKRVKFCQMCSRVKVFVFGFVWKEQDDIYVFERGYSGGIGSMEV